MGPPWVQQGRAKRGLVVRPAPLLSASKGLERDRASLLNYRRVANTELNFASGAYSRHHARSGDPWAA